MPRPIFEGVPYLEVSKYQISCPHLGQFTWESGGKYYVKLNFSHVGLHLVFYLPNKGHITVVNEENNKC